MMTIEQAGRRLSSFLCSSSKRATDGWLILNLDSPINVARVFPIQENNYFIAPSRISQR